MAVAVAGLIAATSGDAVADGVKAVASVVGKDQVTSRSVKDNSLLLRDMKRSERAKLKGAGGSRGAKGDPGLGILQKVTRNSAALEIAQATQAPCPGTPQGSGCYLPVTQFATATVKCDPGQAAVGGGVQPDDNQFAEVRQTHPTVDGLGWVATVGNNDVNAAHRAEVTVLCTPGAPG